MAPRGAAAGERGTRDEAQTYRSTLPESEPAAVMERDRYAARGSGVEVSEEGEA